MKASSLIPLAEPLLMEVRERFAEGAPSTNSRPEQSAAHIAKLERSSSRQVALGLMSSEHCGCRE